VVGVFHFERAEAACKNFFQMVEVPEVLGLCASRLVVALDENSEEGHYLEVEGEHLLKDNFYRSRFENFVEQVEPEISILEEDAGQSPSDAKEDTEPDVMRGVLEDRMAVI